MRKIVPLVVAGVFVATAVAAATPAVLQVASQRSGLHILRPIRTVIESSTAFGNDLARELAYEYPVSLQSADHAFYVGLGLEPAQQTTRLPLASTDARRASYDPRARVVRVLRAPAPTRRELTQAFVRALVDQNFGLRGLSALRARDRDAFVAGNGAVDGIASLASGVAPPRVTATEPLVRFLELERSIALSAGRALIYNLRYIGGKAAVATALGSFPRTTEQLMHLDKFLHREPALSIAQPTTIVDARRTASETFGELDVQALLRAFRISGAASVAAGWGGGRVVSYSSPTRGETVGLVLRWDSLDDAAEWNAIASQYVAAAFPGALAHPCPAVDNCWRDATREVAVVSHDDVTVLGSGADGELIAATLLAANEPHRRG